MGLDPSEEVREQEGVWVEVAVEAGWEGIVPGAGPGGNCVCPACGTKVVHQAGTPCASMNCPKCGIRMVRE